MSTVRELLGRSREYLEGKGVPSPKLDAEYLLAHVLAVRRLELYLDHDRLLEPAEVDRLRELVRRRGKREPLAYVLGSWSFYGLELRCDARALVPRPETEILVERAWRCWRASRLLRRRRRHGHGSDRAGARGAAARGERQRGRPVRGGARAGRGERRPHGLEERVELLQGDLLAPLAGRRFDLVASNPPYVAEGDAVDPEVSGYEPAMAVFAGAGGRAIHERLAADAPLALRPGGRLVVEVAEGQAPWLAEHLAGLGTETSRRRATCVESSGW